MKKTIIINAAYVVAAICSVALVVSLVHLFVSKLGDSLEQVKVITVDDGVKCAVITRTLQTSIDCWKGDNNDSDNKQRKNRRNSNETQGYSKHARPAASGSVGHHGT